MKVWVTRPAAEAAAWVRDLRARGFDSQALPLIDILPAPDPAAVAAKWRQLGSCRSAMFVSANAVRGFHAACPEGCNWPSATRAWATGEGTRQALVEAGVPPSLIDSPSASSAQFDSEALWQEVRLQPAPGDRVLIVRGAEEGAQGDAGRDWLGDRLRDRGALVETVAAYARARPVWDAAIQQAVKDTPGTWIFSSSQAIAHLRALLPDVAFGGWTCVATHPRIARAAKGAGFGVVLESRPGVGEVAATLESIR